MKREIYHGFQCSSYQTFYVDDGEAAVISLEFYSNPAPDDVVWNVVGTQSLQISAGSENER